MTEEMAARDPPLRVMSLHALAYCERLFYLEEVEEIRLADAAVFAGRALHEELRKEEEKEGGEWTSIEMASDRLGLTGKVDCLRRRDGSLIPYEHKRGRSKRKGREPCAWAADALQVSAYGMLLEEHTGRPVHEGRVRYHADNVTVRVPLDDAARESVLRAIERAREIRSSTERPPVAGNDRLCIRCSLAPVCLPEEERLAADPDWNPIRLFPPDREVKTVHVVENGARISRSGETLKVSPPDGEEREFPVREVGAVVIHGYPQISTQALHLCAENDVAVHWISCGGRHIAGLARGAGPVQRRIRQYRALDDPNMRLMLARKLAMAKVEGALRYLLRSTRGDYRKSLPAEKPAPSAGALPEAPPGPPVGARPSEPPAGETQQQATDPRSRDAPRRGPRVAESLETLRSCLKRMARATGLDELRGHEGLAGRAYFAALPELLRPAVPAEMRFDGRNRRPPKDRFNALLGFGYALLYQTVLQAILTVGLEPALGFFHTPRSSAHPLVLDLMELFRVPLWDMVLVGSVNRLQWNPSGDFEIAGERVWLSDEGRRKAIQLFENRLQETWKHPVVSYSLTYARLVELEVRLLEKEWSGQPGLFARMRLR